MEKTGKTNFLSRFLLGVTVCLLAVSVSCSDGGDNSGGFSDMSQQIATWQKETFEKMYQVNSRDAVFARHKNFQLKTTIADAGKALGMYSNTVYSEKDCFYTEDDYSSGTVSLFYDTFYSGSTLYYRKRLDVASEMYVNCYAMTEAEKKEALPDVGDAVFVNDGRSYGEKLISVVSNGDGTVTVLTGLPIENAPDFDSGVPEKWKGATVEYVSVLNAQSLELIRSSTSVVATTERILLYSQEITFDVEPSENFVSLKAFAEKIENNNFNPTNKITVYYNYGTAQQEKYEFQRDGSFKIWLFSRDDYSVFKDVAGTEPIENFEEYNTDAAEISLYLVKQASSSPALDAFYRNMIKANSYDGTFARRTNYFQTMEYGPGAAFIQIGEDGSRAYFYLNKNDGYYYSTSNLSLDADAASFEDVIYTPTGSYVHERKDGVEKWSADWYVMSESERGLYLPDVKQLSIVGDGRSQGETIVSVKDNGDGTRTAVTVMPIEYFPVLAGLVPNEWKGASMEFTYLLDATTYEVEEVTSTVIVNGERILLYKQLYSYNVEEPARYALLKAFAAKVEKKDFTVTKTITAFYDYGTAGQEKFEYGRDASFSIGMLLRDGYEPYKDAAGTKPFAEGERIDSSEEDITVYLFKKN